MKAQYNFTKKDLIVVLGCVIFLLANLGTIGSSGRRRAKEAVCLSNLRKWGLVFQMYAEDNDGYFHGELGENYMQQGWVPALRPYYGDPRIRLCPMAAKKFRSDGYVGSEVAWGVYKGDTSDEGAWWASKGDYGSYGLNGWVCNEEPSVSDWWDQVGNLWRTPSVKGAKNVPLFADCAWVDGWPQESDEPPEWEGQIGMYFFSAMRQFCVNRHSGYVNSAFLDFSARKVGLKELWTLKWHRQFYIDGPWTIAGGVTRDDWPEWMRDFQDY